MDDRIYAIIEEARKGEQVQGNPDMHRHSFETQLIERLATELHILNTKFEELSALVIVPVA